MPIKLQAKGKKLSINLEFMEGDSLTLSVFKDPRFQLSKRLEAVAIGLRSELLMFLLEVEREINE